MLFEVALGLATLLCTLVSGSLFVFAVVAMPGLGTLAGGQRMLLVAAAVVYLAGVQLPTAVVLKR